MSAADAAAGAGAGADAGAGAGASGGSDGDLLTGAIEMTHCLNEVKGSHKNLFLHDDDSARLTTDCDPQCIISITFREAAAISGVAVKAPTDAHTAPKKMMLFANRRVLGFEDVDSVIPTQEIEFDREMLESGKRIKLKLTEFRKVNMVHVFFDGDDDDDEQEKTVITDLKFFGKTSSGVRNVSDIKKVGDDP